MYNLLLAEDPKLYMVLFFWAGNFTWFCFFGREIVHGFVQSKSPIIEHLFQLVKASTFTNMKPDWLVDGHPQAAHLHEIPHRSCITLGQFLRVIHGSNIVIFPVGLPLPKKLKHAERNPLLPRVLAWHSFICVAVCGSCKPTGK